MLKRVSVIGLLLLLMIGFCSCASKQPEKTAAGANASQTPETTTAAVQVATSFGDLSYPEAFEDIIEVEKDAAEAGERFTFYATLEGREVKVYTVVFSANEPENKEYYIGTVPNDSGGRVHVYFEPEDEIISADMSAEDKDLVYSAQETVNDVVDSVKALSGFEEYKE